MSGAESSVTGSRPPSEVASASAPSVDANRDEGTVTSGVGEALRAGADRLLLYRGKTHAIEACRLRDPVTGGVSERSDWA
jgi:hypothetical protein